MKTGQTQIVCQFKITQISSGVAERMKKENGFTLVEILIALLIGSMMMTAIYGVVNMAQRTSTGVERKVIAQQDARNALDLMAAEIRMASFNPNSTTGNWLQSNNCTGVSGNQNYLGIQQATATAITVEMDMNEDCTENDDPVCMRTDVTGTANPNEVITYNYVTTGTNRYITRSTQCGNPQPFLGDTAASVAGQKTVNVINTPTTPITVLNPVIPVFRYYNGVGTDISATVVTNPTDLILGIPAIRRIEITLVVETEGADLTDNTRKRLIYSTSVILKNHIPAPHM